MKKQIREARQKLSTAQQRVAHIQKVVEGFNFLIEKKAVSIIGNGVYLYPELWGSNPKTPPSWMENAYIYLRMKKDFPEGKTVYFKNIETGEIIGRYENGKAIIA